MSACMDAAEKPLNDLSGTVRELVDSLAEDVLRDVAGVEDVLLLLTSHSIAIFHSN